MDALPGIPHGDVLKLLFTLAVLLVTARLLGELAKRLGQPEVIGELLAGVLLGPSVLSGIFPAFGDWILPSTESQAHLLEVVAMIGVILLMTTVGLETDLGLIRARWRTAAGVGIGGLIVPLALGFVGGLMVPENFLASESRFVFSLFLAVALALSAIPVLARVLADLGLLRREFGQTSLAAGLIDDILGWGLLGLVVSLASTGTLGFSSVTRTLVSIALFFLITIFVGRPLVAWALRFVRKNARIRDGVLTLVFGMALAWAAFSQALHLEPILGAFAIGVLFAQVRTLPVDVTEKMESFTNGIFAPIFLATAGLRLSVESLMNRTAALVFLIVFAVAAAGKLIGGYLGARYIAGASIRESFGYGVALNARGVLGVIVATIGLTMGIFGIEVYSMVVLTSMLTSILAPIGLRSLFRDRLEATEDLEEALLDIHRILVPVRVPQVEGDRMRHFEGALLSALSDPGGEIELLTAVESRGRREADAYLKQVKASFAETLSVETRVVKGDAVRAILDAASRGFDLIALGAPARDDTGEFLFGPVFDDVVRLAPSPTLLMIEGPGQWPPRTILVPTGGGAAAERAARLAFRLAGPETEVVLFHVVDSEVLVDTAQGRQTATPVRLDIGHDIVSELRRIGEAAGVRVSSEVVMGSGSMISNIVDRAGRSVDLMVVGTSVRTSSQRLFLGPKVEHLLEASPCATVVYNS
ncbi:MAG TPA: cation:proton antiporter [Acidimicrobiia bacterium]|nr:cation:proton antiporter [Acidimicrobiia bacterium]